MEKLERHSLLSPAYWREAAAEFKNLRVLVFAALIAAAAVAIGTFYIPVGDNLRIKFTFLVQASGALIYGPLVALVVGFCSDILSYLLAPSGPFFPGYTLSAMLCGFVYALYLYRSRVTLLRLFAAKLTVNALLNVCLGSLWSAVMYGKGYLYYMTTSLIKNSILLIPEVILLALLLRILLPILEKQGSVPLRESGARVLPII